MDTWLADASTCEGAASIGGYGGREKTTKTAVDAGVQRQGCSQQRTARPSASASGSGVQRVRSQRSASASPGHGSLPRLLAPLRRRWAPLSWWHGRPRMEKSVPRACSWTAHVSRLTGTRAGALPALPLASVDPFNALPSLAQRQRRARSPLHLASADPSQPVTSRPSPQVPKSPRTKSKPKPKPKLHPVDEPGPASAHPSDS